MVVPYSKQIDEWRHALVSSENDHTGNDDMTSPLMFKVNIVFNDYIAHIFSIFILTVFFLSVLKKGKTLVEPGW